MAGRARYTSTRERQRLEMVKLRDQGMTQAEIADELGISQATVSRDLKVMTKRYINQSKREMAKLIQREIYAADFVEAAALELWDNEKDHNLLKRILEASDRRAKLLGLVTDKHDITSDGKTISLSADKLADIDRQADRELAEWNPDFGGDDDSTT